MAGERYKDANYNTSEDSHFHSPDGDILFLDGFSVMEGKKLTKLQEQAKKDLTRV